MKTRTFLFFIAVLMVGSAPWLIAKPGCMDNSWHLKKPYDMHTYHYVSCACPCDYYRSQGLYASRKHKCLECGHKHDAQTTLILEKIPQARAISVPPTVKRVLFNMISHWKQQSKTPTV